MAFLKEDGSLDIERINSLPLRESMEAIGDLTQEQYKDYISKLAINESMEPVRAITVDWSIEEELERRAITHEELMNILKI